MDTLLTTDWITAAVARSAEATAPEIANPTVGEPAAEFPEASRVDEEMFVDELDFGDGGDCGPEGRVCRTARPWKKSVVLTQPEGRM